MWRYCFINRADTLYQYGGYSALKIKHPNPLLLHTWSDTHGTDWGVHWSAVRLVYSGHWATDHMSIGRAPRNTLGASILDSAVSIKKPSEEEERERGGKRRGESKWIVKSIILGLNTSIWLLKGNQQKKLTVHDCDCEHSSLSLSVGHTHQSSWEKPGSVSSMHFPACPWKQMTVPSTLKSCPPLLPSAQLHASE